MHRPNLQDLDYKQSMSIIYYCWYTFWNQPKTVEQSYKDRDLTTQFSGVRLICLIAFALIQFRRKQLPKCKLGRYSRDRGTETKILEHKALDCLI